MTLTTAAASSTSTASSLLPVIAVLALLWAVGYVAACALWPFAACRSCHGTAKHRSPSGRAWRRCRRCKGSGARIRLGRQLWTAWTRTRNRASR